MKTLVFDCNFLCHRAKHTMGDLSWEEKQSGVIFGFFKQMRSIMNMFKTNDIVFCWDSKKSLRTEVYPMYKHKRHQEKSEGEIEFDKITYAQFDIIKKLMPELGFSNTVCFKGYESDDTMHSIVKTYGVKGKSPKEFVLVTSDEDMYQSLEYCDIWNPAKKMLFTEDWFRKIYNIPPNMWSQVKAIGGCKSDNVTGILGVGEKTAIKYINGELPIESKKYQDITSKIGKKIIKTNTPLVALPYKGLPEINLYENEELDIGAFVSMCKKYGFKSFLTGIGRVSWETCLRGDGY